MTNLYETDADGKLQLHLHHGQTQAWDSQKRFVFILAGTQSGKCLSPNALVPLTNGKRVMVKHIQVGDEIICLTPNLKIGKSVVTHVLHNGIQKVYKILTTSGRQTIVTAEHPLYTVNGWVSLQHIRKGDFVGVPRVLGNLGSKSHDINELKIIGYLLGDGGTTHDSPIFTNADDVVLKDLESCLPDEVSLKYIGRYDYRISGTGGKINPVTALIRKYDMAVKSKIKRIPEFVFSLDNEFISVVLNALFACDGWVDAKGFGIGLASEGMIDDIYHLLLRFGILSRKRYKAVYLDGKKFDSWCLSIADLDSLVSLADNIGILGKQRKLEALINSKLDFRKNTKDIVADFDILQCYDLLGVRGYKKSYADPEGYNLVRSCRRNNVSRPYAQLLSDHFNTQGDRAYSDIYWDTVKSIEYVGESEVMDLTVEDGHNFVADDIFLHNTSFLPWLLWREIQRCGGGDYLAVSPTFPLLDKKMLPEFLKVFHHTLHLGKWWAANKTYEIFNPETGEGATRFHDPMWARVMFCSAKNADSLESATAKAAVLDEVGQNDFRVGAWDAVIRRLSLNHGRLFGATTLYNLGWLKQFVYDPWRRGERTDIDIIQFKSIENPMFPLDEYNRAKSTMPGWKFRMFYEGEYDRPAGMIYDSFDFELCVVPPFALPTHWKIYAGIDFGGQHMAALFTAQDPDTKRFYHFQEYLAGGRSISQHTEQFRNIMLGEPERWIGGAAPEEQWRVEFREAGIPVMPPPITDVEVGIARTYGYHRRNQIFVFNTLTRYLDQKGSYSRKLNDLNQPTEDIENKNEYHLLDAERVLFADIWEKQGGPSYEVVGEMGKRTKSRWSPPRPPVAVHSGVVMGGRWNRGRKW